MILKYLGSAMALKERQAEAEARKRHFECRLVEIINRKPANETARRGVIERLAVDIYDAEREIEDCILRMRELEEVGA